MLAYWSLQLSVFMTIHPRRVRPGYTMIELLMVVGVIAVVFALAIPRMTTIKSSSSLRAGKQQLASAFAAARGAALQKGKTSTLIITGNTLRVRVLSGLNGTLVTVFGPVRLYETVGVTLEPLGSALSVVNYNARGLMTDPPADPVMKYEIKYGTDADTLCISRAGLILSKRCSL